MTVEERIRNRQISVIGMARSGVAAALLALEMGGKPFVSDTKPAELLTDAVNRLKDKNIPFEAGGHSDRVLNSDYIIISPGVPPEIDIIKKARQRGIPVFSEIEFAYWVCKGVVIAVTGSNGKTTTTTLLGEIFSRAGWETYVCGNIGYPFAEIAHKVSPKGVAVVEVSNFQLEGIADFKPHAAAILNLTPDHLDRHGSFEAYKKVKFRITENQDEIDTLVLNMDDPEVMAERITTRAKKMFFTTGDNPNAATCVKDGYLCGAEEDAEERIINTEEILIPGPHNLQNASAAVSIARLFDIDKNIIREVLSSFPGVEHRLENVGKVAGINFVNDSKATNVDSVCFALRSINTPLYLIAGGRDKGASYAPIIKWGKDKIKGIIVIGEAKDKIFNALGQDFSVQFADTLEKAVGVCFGQAYPGETVLLSPGCASFDMFENFEHRGRVFKEAVANLKNGRKKNENVTG